MRCSALRGMRDARRRTKSALCPGPSSCGPQGKPCTWDRGNNTPRRRTELEEALEWEHMGPLVASNPFLDTYTEPLTLWRGIVLLLLAPLCVLRLCLALGMMLVYSVLCWTLHDRAGDPLRKRFRRYPLVVEASRLGARMGSPVDLSRLPRVIFVPTAATCNVSLSRVVGTSSCFIETRSTPARAHEDAARSREDVAATSLSPYEPYPVKQAAFCACVCLVSASKFRGGTTRSAGFPGRGAPSSL